MKERILESGEDYLETILLLHKKTGFVRSIDIANELSYSKPSISRAMNILKENICVNKDIQHDAGKFATASEIVNGVGNYDKALELLDLKKDTTMFRQGKPAAFLQTLVAEVGIDTKASLNFEKSQNNLVNAIDNQRLSIGGVDTEEEAMNLMRFQQAYKLSAQVISVMNEIYDKLINYMGV